jgi:hypothetical protein
MDILPPGQQHRLLFNHDPNRAADPGSGHAISPNQFRSSACSEQIDLGVTVTEDVHVSRLVIVDEDDNAQAVGMQDGDHRAK